jgi:hypothetical protein
LPAGRRNRLHTRNRLDSLRPSVTDRANRCVMDNDRLPAPCKRQYNNQPCAAALRYGLASRPNLVGPRAGELPRAAPATHVVIGSSPPLRFAVPSETTDEHLANALDESAPGRRLSK